MLFRAGVAGLFLLGALSVGAARAESQDDREACTPDVYAHCGDFIPNRDLIVQCLKKKINQLSPACRQVMRRPYHPNSASN
jgi:hypothetical protein